MADMKKVYDNLLTINLYLNSKTPQSRLYSLHSYETYSIQTFKVEVRSGELFIELPTAEVLTKLHLCDSHKKSSCA